MDLTYSKDSIESESNDSSYTFPLDWLGHWSGQLKMYDSTGQRRQILMALDISKTDTSGLFNWTIIYNVDSTVQRKEYQLREINSKIGHYLIDEKNGILLDAFLIQSELTSIFEVLDNTLLISYNLKDQEIIFSVKVYPSKEIRTSGAVAAESKDIPEVKIYRLKSSQIARLYKKCLVE